MTNFTVNALSNEASEIYHTLFVSELCNKDGRFALGCMDIAMAMAINNAYFAQARLKAKKASSASSPQRRR